MLYSHKRLILYIVLLIAILVIWWIISGFIFAAKPEKEISLNECFTAQVNMPYYPTVRTYGTLIDCLVRWESGGNPEAIGDDGKALGILQFHEPTFKQFCVERYGYEDDIWDTEIQQDCCNEMLLNNLGHHWSTYYKCRFVLNAEKE